MKSYITGSKQYSPICNTEEGDESSLKLKLQDGVSPMTYKKLKEMGYTSDDWQNWSDDEKVEKSHEGKESVSANEKSESSPQSSKLVKLQAAIKSFYATQDDFRKRIKKLEEEHPEEQRRYQEFADMLGMNVDDVEKIGSKMIYNVKSRNEPELLYITPPERKGFDLMAVEDKSANSVLFRNALDKYGQVRDTDDSSYYPLKKLVIDAMGMHVDYRDEAYALNYFKRTSKEDVPFFNSEYYDEYVKTLKLFRDNIKPSDRDYLRDKEWMRGKIEEAGTYIASLKKQIEDLNIK